MRWVVIFETTPHMPTIRTQHETAHLKYLREHQTEILLAGGLREEPEAAFDRGLWVLAPMPKARAIELIEQDPYFIHSQRGYQLLQWGKALQDIFVLL
jgi:uncharacterized protein YciI